MKKASIIIAYTVMTTSILAWVAYRNQINTIETIHVNESPSLPEIEDITYEVNFASPGRADITFIFSNDEVSHYAAAKQHYASNSNALIVEKCQSLLDVIQYLEKNSTPNGEPWGNIRIVNYNPDWQGIHIMTEEERNFADEIVSAMDAHAFNPLDDHIVDASTVVTVEGTGMGNNQDMLELIASAMGGNDTQRPCVSSSQLMTTYHHSNTESYAYLTESFFGFFPSSDSLDQGVLVTQLQNNYPNEEMDWWEALDRLAPRFPGDSYAVYKYEDDLTTVCILRALTVPSDEEGGLPLPFEPDMEDGRFFNTACAESEAVEL